MVKLKERSHQKLKEKFDLKFLKMYVLSITMFSKFTHHFVILHKKYVKLPKICDFTKLNGKFTLNYKNNSSIQF